MNNYIKTYVYNSEFYIWENIIKSHLLFKRVKLEDQFISILVYFCMYGINKNTTERLLSDGIIKNKGNVSNAKTFLKEKDLIIKIRNKQWELADFLKDIKIDKEFNFLIKCKIKS